MGTPRLRSGRFFGGLFFLKAESRSRIKIKLKINCREFVPALAWPGTGGLAGHAVNPSMGARGRHPWRPTVPPTHPYPALDSVLGRNERATSLSAWRCFALCGYQPTVEGGGVWVRGTVGRHGWRSRASKDGFTACPADSHTPAQPGAAGNAAFGGASRSGFFSGFFEPVRCDVLSHVLRVPDAAVHGDVYTAGQRLHRADRAADVELRV